jgi:hypothetical protein
MEKIVGKEREVHTKEMANLINEVSTMSSEPEDENETDVIDREDTIIDVEEVLSIMSAASISIKDETEVLQNENIISTDTPDSSTGSHCTTGTSAINESLTLTSKTPEVNTQELDVEVKKELAEDEVRRGRQRVSIDVGIQKRFSPEEDLVLKQGIEKHGFGKWSVMLKDKSLKFHPSRARDSLRMRASSLGLTKKKGMSKRKNKNNTD